ncbi:hypothetical protein HG536_0B04070 [Torulaspora globosa]|uniref:PCI domain-containing protein n=1 Tax=Torulaspora globosa TaxID=48254 RepID=A0A7G3ZDF7_9SACH|nr:uncharacterized protein HG536_0B04070 [Torulaspora globosa]QLL31543.1 hypothetical protein HG536_0B04070 [Torulaspora globosa]
MVKVNLNRYFVEKRYDDQFLQFLRNDNFNESQDFILTLQNDGKLDQLYNVTMELKFQCWVNDNRDKRFELADEQLRLLNRIAEQETNWIVYPLYVVANQYFQIAQKTRTSASGENLLERCGRTIHRSFNLCLNDRNPELPRNRKIGCYLFANLEFQLYRKLENRDMAKNLVKVLQSRVNEIPTLSQSLAAHHAKHKVLYNYYMGEYYGCYESDFQKGFTYLQEALLECSTSGSCDAQIDRILLLLVPFALLTRRLYPNFHHTALANARRHRRAAQHIYQPIIKSLLTGNLKDYDAHFAKHELFFLRNGLFVAMSLLRELVLLKLVKTCWTVLNHVTVVPLSTIAIGYLASLHGTRKKPKRLTTPINDSLLDELECQLANLICKNAIKGYLSHSNRCLVLSKKDPFPHSSHVTQL